MFASVAYASDVVNFFTQPITTLVSVVITVGNIVLNNIVGVTEVAIGTIPGIRILPGSSLIVDAIEADGKCRLSNTSSGVLEVYVGRCVNSTSGSTIFIPDFDCTFAYQPTFYIPQFYPIGVSCRSGIFGSDPIPGVVKHCDIRPDGMRVSSIGSEGETVYDYTTGDAWTFCANENQQCEFTGTKEVRYGANGAYLYGTFTNANTDIFNQVAIYRFYIPSDTPQAALNDWYFNSVPNAVGNGFTDVNAFESIGYHTSIAPEAQPFDTKPYSEICSGNVCDKIKDNSVPPNSYVVYVAKMLGDYSWGGYLLPNKFLNTDNGPTADFPNPTLGNVILGPLRTGPCPTCSNGAINPPTCNTCTAPLVWNGSSCSSAPTVCHCSRCSTINDRQWVEFDSTDSTGCATGAAINPVTRSLNCTCRAGDASWYNSNYPGVCR